MSLQDKGPHVKNSWERSCFYHFWSAEQINGMQETTQEDSRNDLLLTGTLGSSTGENRLPPLHGFGQPLYGWHTLNGPVSHSHPNNKKIKKGNIGLSHTPFAWSDAVSTKPFQIPLQSRAAACAVKAGLISMGALPLGSNPLDVSSITWPCISMASSMKARAMQGLTHTTMITLSILILSSISESPSLLPILSASHGSKLTPIPNFLPYSWGVHDGCTISSTWHVL